MRGFDLGLIGELDDLHRFGEGSDFFLALGVADFGQDRRGVDDLGLRKGLADFFVGAVQNRSFRRARAFDFAEAGDADAAAFDIQFF